MRHRPAMRPEEHMHMNGHAACNDGSAPTGNAYLLFSPNTVATLVEAEARTRLARTTRTVWGMSPRWLASHGGIAG